MTRFNRAEKGASVPCLDPVASLSPGTYRHGDMPALFGKQAAGIKLTRLGVCKSAALLKALLSQLTAGSQARASLLKMSHGTAYFSTLSSLPERTVDLWSPDGNLRVRSREEEEGRVYVCSRQAKSGGSEHRATWIQVLFSISLWNPGPNNSQGFVLVCFPCLSASPSSWFLHLI